MQIVAGLIALLIAGAAAAQPVSGKIRGGVYSNPDETFRIPMSALVPFDAVVVDGAPEEGVWQVEFSDDRCRTFTVSEHHHSVPPADFGFWLDGVVVPGIEAAGGEEVEVRRVGSAIGESALIRYWKPAAAPCRLYDRVSPGNGAPMRLGSRGGAPLQNEEELREAGWTIWHPTARVALQIVAVGDRTYSFSYVIGQGVTAQADWIGPPSLPMEARLAEFVDGFEILR